MLLAKLTNSNLTLSRETCLITSIPARKAKSGGYVWSMEQWTYLASGVGGSSWE